MNYINLYENLILSRINRVIDNSIYTEKHHIIPKSLGGTNNKENLIRLTFKEHYMAHYILSKIYPRNSSIQYGFSSIMRNPYGHRKLTSGMYSTIKRNNKKFHKWRIYETNPGKSEKSREKARERMLNRNPIKLNPSKNHTARKTTIYFDDGRIEKFDYAKEFCNKYNIPYATFKWCYKRNIGIKKHGVLKIIKDD